MFNRVVLYALRRCADRHELWLNFIINCVPYLDRTLATFSVQLVDQLCRNMYACVSANFSGLAGINEDCDLYDSLASEPPTPSMTFDDYRLQKTDVYSGEFILPVKSEQTILSARFQACRPFQRTNIPSTTQSRCLKRSPQSCIMERSRAQRPPFHFFYGIRRLRTARSAALQTVRRRARSAAAVAAAVRIDTQAHQHAAPARATTRPRPRRTFIRLQNRRTAPRIRAAMALAASRSI